MSWEDLVSTVAGAIGFLYVLYCFGEELSSRGREIMHSRIARQGQAGGVCCAVAAAGSSRAAMARPLTSYCSYSLPRVLIIPT